MNVWSHKLWLAAISPALGPVLGLMLVCSSARGQECVELLQSVTIEHESTVTLGQIAKVSGPHADVLASIQVPAQVWTKGESGLRTLDITRVRDFLGATPGINMGRIALSGSRVELRRAVVILIPKAPSVSSDAAAQDVGTRVRDLIPERIAQAMTIPLAALRITLDESDADLLNTSLVNRTATITPMGDSDRAPLHIRVYEGDRLILARSTRVGVLVRRDVVLAQRAIRKGELLDPSILRSEERWLPPSVASAPYEQIVGKSARSAIDAGEIVDLRDAEEPIVVRKGERIVVDCIVEGVLVRSTMRAAAQARVGDVIMVQPLVAQRELGGKGASRSQTKTPAVFARISGPGRGVVTTSQPAPTSQATDVAASQTTTAFVVDRVIDHQSNLQSPLAMPREATDTLLVPGWEIRK